MSEKTAKEQLMKAVDIIKEQADKLSIALQALKTINKVNQESVFLFSKEVHEISWDALEEIRRYGEDFENLQ